MPITLTINGACGRMGRELVALAASDPELRLVSLWEGDSHPQVGTVDAATGLPVSRQWSGVAGSVIVDFSTPGATATLLDGFGGSAAALVSGTTGLGAMELERLKALSSRVPVLHSANMSLGVAVMHRLLRAVAQVVSPDWDVEMMEMHHRRKADAPSGTALALARTLSAAWKGGLTVRCGREGAVGARPSGEVGVLALRGGDVVGEHEVIFAGPGEVLRVRHDALSRTVFAAGALRAARYLARARPGFYTMDDVLGI
jgi:4-hydroxy-tetrahydrodipicolinate reductase